MGQSARRDTPSRAAGFSLPKRPELGNASESLRGRPNEPGSVIWSPALGGCVFFVSAGLLGYELALMRVLLVASWHHFAFLVISIALLGFGASGTALCLLRRLLVPRGPAVVFTLALASAAAMPICLGLAQYIPVEARILPATLWKQLAYWALYWLLLGVPFFLGAGAVGLALTIGGSGVPRIYAANLLGSGAGLALSTALMRYFPPEWLPPCMAAPAWLGAAVMAVNAAWRSRHHSEANAGFARRASRLGTPGRPFFSCGGCAVVVVVWCMWSPPHIRLDPYKYGAYVRRLERQEEAERVAVRYGPRAVVEAYRSNRFHDLPFLSLALAPPAMSVLTTDGHFAGSVLEVASAQEAEVVDHTVAAFPYFLHDARTAAPAEKSGGPRGAHVLLLGETGGNNVWLASRHGARSITVVQPNPSIPEVLRGPVRPFGGNVLVLPEVSVVEAQPRHVVEQSSDRFDLIQLVTLESSAAGSGGIAGLAEDHLITVEGIAECMRRLSDDGMLAVTRGIQTPHRDNLKLFATFIAAARRAGLQDPGRHLVVVRDFLAVCTILKRSPWTPSQIDRVREAYAQRQLTPVWFPEIRPDELNHPDTMAGPADSPGDWLHHGLRELLGPNADAFMENWPFHIRPPTDDQPFFLDFFKLSALGELRRVFGDLWLTRVEMAFPIVLTAIAGVAVAGAVLTILPLLFVPDYRRATGLSSVLAYFAAIGLGYILLEMTLLSSLTRWIGDPITAAAVTIGGFLFASGLGSLTAQRVSTLPRPQRVLPWIVAGIILSGLTALLLVDQVAAQVGSLPYLGRCAVALTAITPLGYLMGFPMPLALARLQEGNSQAIPWAWGVNGFASVVAAPLATAIGMSHGYSTAGAVAVLLYLVPLFGFQRLPLSQTHTAET